MSGEQSEERTAHSTSDIELSDSNEFRAAYKCEECRTIWYGQNEGTALTRPHSSRPPNNYCPNCGEHTAEKCEELPGAVLLPVRWRTVNTATEHPADSE